MERINLKRVYLPFKLDEDRNAREQIQAHVNREEEISWGITEIPIRIPVFKKQKKYPYNTGIWYFIRRTLKDSFMELRP